MTEAHKTSAGFSSWSSFGIFTTNFFIVQSDLKRKKNPFQDPTVYDYKKELGAFLQFTPRLQGILLMLPGEVIP